MEKLNAYLTVHRADPRFQKSRKRERRSTCETKLTGYPWPDNPTPSGGGFNVFMVDVDAIR